jgi:hypothetical protein
MTGHEQVKECADTCVTCHRTPHLIILPKVAVLECPSLAHPLNRVERPDVEQAITAWNVKQRRAKG